MKKPSRHQTRFVCVQAVIQGMITDFSSPLENYLHTSNINIDEVFCKQIYDIVHQHGELISEILGKKIKAKPVGMLDLPVKAILFCAVAEMFYLNTDKKIVINEYVVLSKRLARGNNYKMINAVLDILRK